MAGVKDSMRWRAWGWWAGLLALPVALLAAVRWAGPLEPVGWNVGTILVTTAGALWLGAAMPAALMLRGHCFRALWRGRAVDGRSYLRGMLTVWVTAEFAAVAGALGAAATGSWLPCAALSALGVMLIAVLWPSGRAIERGEG